MEGSINQLIDDLLWPTTAVTRTIAAVAKGDLLHTVPLDVDGRPLKGEFLRSAGIVNTMIMAIYERTREIGILKALGSTSGDVLRMFMVEAGLIGLLGGIVGVFLGWLLGLGLNQVILDYLRREQVPIDAPFFVLTWELVVGALVFATLVGILAGLYPAFRAARLDPLAALRHE